MSFSLLYRRAQTWPRDSRGDVTSAEWRGRITSLDLLATLDLMQPRIPLPFFAPRPCCWLMVKLVSTRTPKFFPAKLLSSWASLSIYWCMDPSTQGSFLGAGLFISHCWSSWGSFQLISPACPAAEWQHDPLVYQLLLPVCVIFRLAEDVLCHIMQMISEYPRISDGLY